MLGVDEVFIGCWVLNVGCWWSVYWVLGVECWWIVGVVGVGFKCWVLTKCLLGV